MVGDWPRVGWQVGLRASTEVPHIPERVSVCAGTSLCGVAFTEGPRYGACTVST